MRAIVLLLAFALLALAQDSTTPSGATPCPAASCGTFPESNPCTVCADGTQGGCLSQVCIQTTSSNADGAVCAWYQRPPCVATAAPNSQPVACPDLVCADSEACPYGNSINADGCPTCGCLKPNCDNVACPDLACNPATSVTIPPHNGTCCPTCILIPTGVCPEACPLIACPTSTDGATVGINIDDCGCQQCIPTNCTNVACPDIACADADNNLRLFRPPGACCPICTAPPHCLATAICDIPDCGNRSKPVVLDGYCCPVCVPIPSCDGLACDPIVCPDGQVLTKVDTECCSVCRNVEVDCDAVLCQNANATAIGSADSAVCHPIFQNQRSGDCCGVCSYCRQTETNLIRCLANDQPVCAPGISTGDGVTCKPVPNPSLNADCRTFTISFSAGAGFGILTSASGNDELSNRIAKYALLQVILSHTDTATAAELLAALHYMNATVVKKSNDQIVITVCFAAATGDTTVDPTSLGTGSQDALEGAGATSPSPSPSTTGASASTVPTIFLAACLALLLLLLVQF